MFCKISAKTIDYDFQCLFKAMGMEDAGLTCGAVCVYPNRVAECVHALKRFSIKTNKLTNRETKQTNRETKKNKY